MRCAWCATELTKRSGARTCSVACRKALTRIDFPSQLKAIPTWVKHESKRPVMFSGGFASSTNPATWCDFESAQQSCIGDGLGFVLTGNGIACIDLDHCITDGVLSDWAKPIVAAARGTYIEISLSGTGLHIFGLGVVGTGKRFDGIELYDRGRFIAVTGRRYKRAPLQLTSIQHVLDSV